MNLLDVRPVVVITGISASGKSTVADVLARRFPRGVHVKGDVYRRMVVAGREEMSDDPSEEAWSQLRLRYRLAASTADAYHDAGFAVVAQDVIIGPVLADYVAAIQARPLVVVVLTPRSDVVAARERGRAKTAYRADAISIDALDHALRTDTPAIGMWLDTSEHSPEETVDVIVRDGLARGQIR